MVLFVFENDEKVYCVGSLIHDYQSVCTYTTLRKRYKNRWRHNKQIKSEEGHEREREREISGSYGWLVEQ